MRYSAAKSLFLAIVISALVYFLYNIANLPGHAETSQSANTESAATVTNISASQELTKNMEEILNLVDKEDPRKALAALAARMKDSRVVFRNCHAIAHEIGRAAYTKYQDFVEAMKYGDFVCSNGYLHGVIEARFAKTKNIFTEIKQICNNYKEGLGRCYHGVGHGIMYYTANDLPRSLSICETYSHASARGRCYEGVFMENFVSTDNAHPSKYRDSKNPFYPCQTQQGRHKPYCYFYAPAHFLNLNGDDYFAALKWCGTAESGYKNSCARGLGSLAMKYNIDQPGDVEKICLSGGSNQTFDHCVRGMTSYFLTYHDRLSKAREMCAALEQRSKPHCEKEVRSKIGQFRE